LGASPVGTDRNEDVSFGHTDHHSWPDHATNLDSPAGWKDHCKMRELSYELNAIRRPLGQLGAWEGVPASGDSLISEGSPGSGLP